MELRTALRTTGAVREFEPREVPRALLYDLLDTARFAPSGGNRQGWRVVVVDDAAVRSVVRSCYLAAWYEYLAQAAAGLVPFSPTNDRDREREAMGAAGALAEAAAASGGGFAEHVDEAPALLVVVADLDEVAALDRDDGGYTFVGGASVYPFCWSLLLAAHDAGLGGVLTTMVRRHDEPLRAALGLEAHHEIAALIALGWPRRRATRLRRTAVGEFATIVRLRGAPLGP